MSDPAALFATITAALEDMHAVAVGGQPSGLTAEEAWALLTSLKHGVHRVSRTMADIALTLG